MTFAVVVLAAGRGTRMRSRTPKVLHELAGRPLAAWPIAAALEAGAERVVVVQSPEEPLAAVVAAAGERVTSAVQPTADGTAGAVIAALPSLAGADTVVVLTGDAPLIEASVIRELVDRHTGRGAAATVLGATLDDPTGYGRIVRDEAGAVLRIVETKDTADATEEILRVREVNAGIYAFDGGLLLGALEQIGTDNAQGERYLPDLLEVMRAGGGSIGAVVAGDPSVVLGVNDRWQLLQVGRLLQDRIVRGHALAGVTFPDAAGVLIDADVTIGEDTLVEPGVQLRAGTTIGRDCHIGQGTVIVGSDVADGATIRASTLDGATVGEGASVGPYAYLRPGARLETGAKAGTFVEIKNSVVGEGTKVPHLSYIGDADIGPGTNLGAGTITANYDGRKKHRTTIGAGVKGGVHTSFIAPVTIGDRAWTAAGSVVTKDVAAGALAVARARQHTIEGYDDRGE